MRSDAKLGLALGMLVIGFAVAFCFPRPGRVSHVTGLQKPTLALDEPEIEFVQLRSLREERSKLADAGLPPRLNQPPHREHSSVVPTEAGSANNPPEPTADISVQSGLSDLLFSNDMPSAEGAESFAPVLPENLEIAESAPNATTYRVQANDTLSGIAMKTLGSYSRYLDIYAANRNQLSSPDALRPGMQLHIPTRMTDKASLSKKQTASPKNFTNHEELNAEGKKAQQFRGAQGAPFLSNRTTDVPVNQIQAGKVTSYVIQSGDTLEGIAIRYFGTRRAVEQLRQANPELTRNPQSLRPGAVLQLIP